MNFKKPLNRTNLISESYESWSPTDKSTYISLDAGNRISTCNSTGHHAIRATSGKSYGFRQFECSPLGGSIGFNFIGIGLSTAGLDSSLGSSTLSWGYYWGTGNKYYNNVSTSYGAAYGASDIIGVSIDLDMGRLSFYKNGISQGLAFSGIFGIIYPMISQYTSGQQCLANFGNEPFRFPISGCIPWNS